MTAARDPLAFFRGFLIALPLSLALWALLVLGAGVAVAHAQETRQEYVRVTYYTLRGTMASGVPVHRDAAACSNWIPLGTQLMFEDGYVVTCEDRGHGDWYWRGWLDVWAPSMEWGRQNVSSYGDYAWVSVVRWGWD